MSTTYETKPCPTRLTLRLRASPGDLPPDYDPPPCAVAGPARLKITQSHQDRPAHYGLAAMVSGECDIEINLATVREIQDWAEEILVVHALQAERDAGPLGDRDES